MQGVTTRKPKGYLRDPAGHCRTTFGVRAKLQAALPDSASLFHGAPPVLLQIASSCTGHGTATALYTAFAVAGAPLPWLPSPAEIYRNARAIDRVISPYMPRLADEGAMPNQVVRSCLEFGVCPSAVSMASDDDLATVNEEPTLLKVEVESIVVDFSEYAIPSFGDGRSIDAVTADIRSAIVQGFPVCFGTYVDTKFEDWTPDQGPMGMCDPNDPNGGGHWMAILSYRTDVAGRLVFGVRNSWGGWGADGNIDVDQGFISQCTDISVFVPRLKGAA